METHPGPETPQSQAPGTLEKFHLGLAADGTSCAMVFVDDQHRSIACVASFADLNGFIVSLTRAAGEMARRRRQDGQTVPVGTFSAAAMPSDAAADTTTLASSEFRQSRDDDYVVGTLVADDGHAVSVRMTATVANEMTRNMLRAARAVSNS